MADTPNLLANAQRMLVDTQRELLNLAEQIGKGERQGCDGETAVLIGAISARIGDALGLLFDSERPKGHRAAPDTECARMSA